MPKGKVSVDLRDVARNITVMVRYRKGWIVALGAALVRLGCRIAGFQLEEELIIEGDDGEAE